MLQIVWFFCLFVFLNKPLKNWRKSQLPNMGFPGKFQITHGVYCSREWWDEPTGSRAEVSIQAQLGCSPLKAPGFHPPENSRPLVTTLISCYLPRTVRKIHGNITFQLAGKRITPQSREILFSLIPLEHRGGGGGCDVYTRVPVGHPHVLGSSCQVLT